MYVCGVCKIQQGPKVPSNITAVESRPKTYPARHAVGDPGGQGYETVREVNRCPSCVVNS